MNKVTALLLVALQSLLYRLSGVALAIVAVTISVFVLLSVEHVRHEARSSFASTVSDVDLIVGARTGDINLLLLSVFRIGNPTANISWESVEAIAEQPQVDWVVPLSLGDSHKSYRVVGTSANFFEHYKHGQSSSLRFSAGKAFTETLDVVLGARVATELSYTLGEKIILSHGMADVSFTHHDQQTFSVSGVLTTTGTPVDNALYVSLDAIAAMHADEETAEAHSESIQESTEREHTETHHQQTQRSANQEHDEHDEHEHEYEYEYEHDGSHHEDSEHAAEHDRDDHDEQDGHHDHDHPVGSVTALLVGLDSAAFSLQLQRWVNEFEDEALLAILPGFALAQLWDLVGGIENVLRGISILVFLSALFGLNAMMLASMRERKREIEILRSIGAPSLFIVSLLVLESLLIVSVGVVFAIAGLFTAITFANSSLASELGLVLSLQILHPSSFVALALIFATTVLLSLLPAWRAYAAARSYDLGGQQN